PQGGGTGGGSKAQDHNSTRSNKTASVADGTGPQGGGTGGGSKAQDHNSTRSNKTASVVDNIGTGGSEDSRGFQFSFAPGYVSPLSRTSSADQFLYRGSSVSSKITADYFFGKLGIGLSNGFMVTRTDRDAFAGYISSLGYDETTADLSSSDAQGGFLVIGPVFQTGRRLKIAIDGRAGLFVSTPGVVSADIKGEGVAIMRVSGGTKTVMPGFSGGVSVRYAVTPLVSIGLNSEYTGTKTGISYYDGKTRLSTESSVTNQNLVTALTMSISLGRGKQARRLPQAFDLPLYPGSPAEVERPSTSDDSGKEQDDTDASEEGVLFTPDRISVTGPVAYNPELGPACNPNIPDENGNLKSNPLYNGSGNEVTNPLYTGKREQGTNPLWQEGQSSGNNPLYEGKSGGSENPLYNGTAGEGSNVLYEKAGIPGPAGGMIPFYLPQTVEIEGAVSATVGETWLKCYPAAKETDNESSGQPVTRAVIRKSDGISLNGINGSVSAIVEIGGLNYHAMITGKTRTINEAKKSIQSVIR
ncbi:MAG: hypothetical protein IH591_14600, partial [Bacteroidales bacterium]|nr:hypothetical protein [Bacteroidales bacterium]